MRLRWHAAAVVLALCLSYVAYPYVTLLRLALAVHTADAATLEALVDWPSVREGIKEDVCDLAVDDTTARGALPPFGASFVRGIASSTIDQAVTPQALISGTTMASAATAPAPAKPDPMQIDWAFFRDPTTFMVSFKTPGSEDPIRMEMDLRKGAWRVRRIWLPASWLSNTDHHT